MMEVVEGEAAAARPRTAAAVDLGGKEGEDGEREKLLAATATDYDAQHNGKAVANAPGPAGDDPVGRSSGRNGSGGGGSHLEAAPTNGVAANR